METTHSQMESLICLIWNIVDEVFRDMFLRASTVMSSSRWWSCTAWTRRNGQRSQVPGRDETGNPKDAIIDLTDLVICQKCKGDMSLSRKYWQNDTFKAGSTSSLSVYSITLDPK